MGYAMAFACKRKETFDQNVASLKKGMVRFLKLVGLSLWLEGLRSRDGPITPLFKLWLLLFTDPIQYFHILRFFGILSRIGVCFIFVIAVHLFLPKMTFPTNSSGWNILKYNTSGWSLIMFL